VQKRLQTGEFRADQLAHAEELSDWMPRSGTCSLMPGLGCAAVGCARLLDIGPGGVRRFSGLRFAAYLIDGVILAPAPFTTVILGGCTSSIPAERSPRLQGRNENEMDHIAFPLPKLFRCPIISFSHPCFYLFP